MCSLNEWCETSNELHVHYFFFFEEKQIHIFCFCLAGLYDHFIFGMFFFQLKILLCLIIVYCIVFQENISIHIYRVCWAYYPPASLSSHLSFLPLPINILSSSRQFYFNFCNMCIYFILSIYVKLRIHT